MKGVKRVFAAAIVTVGVLLSGMSACWSDEVPKMSKEELRSLLGNTDVVIVDVRQELDWKVSNSKIKGAVRENPGEIALWMNKYPKNKTLVFYCA